MLIDAKVDVRSGAEPRAWQITKINRISPNGLARITLAQDKYNQHSDFIEYANSEENKNIEIVGMWADYWKTNIEPKEPEDIPSPTVHSVITYSGLKPEIKVGGSYKKFTVTFYDDELNENVVPVPSGSWEFKICELNLDASDLVVYEDITPAGEDMYKQIKVKFIGNDEWISKNLHIWYISDTGIKSHINVNIVGI